MISVIQCHGCVHLDFNYETGASTVQKPCHGCFVTSSGWPSNYEPMHYTATSQSVMTDKESEAKECSR